MNKRVVKGWVKRLRSGKYKQGANFLRTQGDEFCNEPARYCCLGVLCDMYSHSAQGKKRRAEWEAEACDDDEMCVRFWVPGQSYSDGCEMPPPEVLEWAGVGQGDAAELAEMNDGGKTFKQIARVIESRLSEEER